MQSPHTPPTPTTQLWTPEFLIQMAPRACAGLFPGSVPLRVKCITGVHATGVEG